MKKNIIIFEGPDCCGKTTQLNLLAKKLKNCIVIHSPRKQTNTTDCFKLTMDTIYNEEFMKKLLEIGEKNLSLFNILRENLFRNIDMNHQDRMNIIRDINRIYNGFGCDFNFVEFEDDYKAYYNGEFIERNPLTMSTKIDNLLEKFVTNPEECYIIFDRFYMSGYVYNSRIPASVIEAYIKTNRHILSESFKECLHNLQYDISHKSFTNDKELDIYLNEFDTKTFVFKPSKIIKEKFSSDNRKYDDYDKNIFINTISSDFYSSNTFICNLYKNCIMVDTDKLYEKNNDISNIEKFIYSHFVEG